MRVLIENYRDWEIYFDTDSEDFYTVSNQYDRQETKRSYASTKKFIDEYIKDNFKFKPIKVRNIPNMWNSSREITLIGIRKDGSFMYEEDGKKQQLSKYSEKDFFKVDSSHDEVFSKIDELSEQRFKIEQQIKKLQDTIIKFDIEQIRQEILNNQ